MVKNLEKQIVITNKMRKEDGFAGRKGRGKSLIKFI
jgi:hypothetical protein